MHQVAPAHAVAGRELERDGRDAPRVRRVAPDAQAELEHVAATDGHVGGRQDDVLARRRRAADREARAAERAEPRVVVLEPHVAADALVEVVLHLRRIRRLPGDQHVVDRPVGGGDGGAAVCHLPEAEAHAVHLRGVGKRDQLEAAADDDTSG